MYRSDAMSSSQTKIGVTLTALLVVLAAGPAVSAATAVGADGDDEPTVNVKLQDVTVQTLELQNVTIENAQIEELTVHEANIEGSSDLGQLVGEEADTEGVQTVVLRNVTLERLSLSSVSLQNVTGTDLGPLEGLQNQTGAGNATNATANATNVTGNATNATNATANETNTTANETTSNSTAASISVQQGQSQTVDELTVKQLNVTNMRIGSLTVETIQTTSETPDPSMGTDDDENRTNVGGEAEMETNATQQPDVIESMTVGNVTIDSATVGMMSTATIDRRRIVRADGDGTETGTNETATNNTSAAVSPPRLLG